MATPRKKRASKQNYWKDIHQLAVEKYVSTSSLRSRETAYITFRPQLRKLIEIVLKKYYGGNIKKSNQTVEELVDDCELHVLEMSLPLYSADRGKAYSFLGTSAKHYFYSRFVTSTIVNRNTISLYTEEHNEPIFDIEYDQFKEFERKESVLEKWYDLLHKIKKIIFDIDNQAYRPSPTASTSQNKLYASKHVLRKNNKKKLFNCYVNILQEFINDERYISSLYLSYRLMKDSGLTCSRIYYLLEDYGLSRSIVISKKLNTVAKFESQFKEHGKDFNSIQEWLYEYKDSKQIGNIQDTGIKKLNKRIERVKDRAL